MANRLALELVADANPLVKTLNDVQRTLNKFTDAADQAGQAVGGSLGGCRCDARGWEAGRSP